MTNTWRPAALLSLLLLTACKGGLDDPQDATQEAAQASAILRYQVVRPERLPIFSDLASRVAAPVEAQIRPRVDGVVLERLFTEGAQVQEGQVLYRLDAAPYRAAVAAAKAELAEAKSQAAQLETQVKRQKGLVGHAISRQDADSVLAQRDQARSRVAKAQAALDRATIDLSHAEIRAPVAGRIGTSAVTVGALVTANQSEPLAKIQQFNPVHLDLSLPLTDMQQLRHLLGASLWTRSEIAVQVAPEDNSPPLQGVLLFRESSVDADTGVVRMRALVPNPDGRLLPGMYARARVQWGEIDDALLIPQRCLQAGRDGYSVLVLQTDTSEQFLVERRTLGQTVPVGNRVLVESGLAAGERVVVEGVQKAMPGEAAQALPMDDESASPQQEQTR